MSKEKNDAWVNAHYGHDAHPVTDNKPAAAQEAGTVEIIGRTYLLRDVTKALAKAGHAPVAAAPDVVNPTDTDSGIDGDWYCERHPWALQGHDSCDGAGLPACARIDMLRHIIRMRDQEIKERDQQYGFLATSALAQQPAAPGVDVDLLEAAEDFISRHSYAWNGEGSHPNTIITGLRTLIAARPKGE